MSRCNHYPHISRWEEDTIGSGYRCHTVNNLRTNVSQTLEKTPTGLCVVRQLNTSHSTQKQNPQLQGVLDKNAVGFTDSHQTLKTDSVKIYVDVDPVPKYYKSRPLQYVMVNKMDKELDRLLAEDRACPVLRLGSPGSTSNEGRQDYMSLH